MPKQQLNLDLEEWLLFMKWKYWKNGISTKEFNKEYVKDIIDIFDIDNAISQKEITEIEIQKTLMSMGRL